MGTSISKPTSSPVNLTVVSSNSTAATIQVSVDQDTDASEIVGFKLYIDGVRWPVYANVDEDNTGTFDLFGLAFGERTFDLQASYFTCSGEGPLSTESLEL